MSEPRMRDPEHLKRVAYPDATRLNARIEFWKRYGRTPDEWFSMYFDLFQPPGDARILEVGCGPGDLWSWGADHDRDLTSWSITLSDLSQGMLDEAMQKLSGLDRDISFVVADVCDLPFDDSSFDVVVANYMLYHASDVALAVSEISRVLTPEGSLYAATNSASHISEIVELQRMFASGTEIAQIDATHDVFTLENGEHSLSAAFTNVETHLDESTAEVDDPDLLVAFVKSMDVQVEQAALRTHVEQVIEDQGHLGVSRSSGILVASRSKKQVVQK